MGRVKGAHTLGRKITVRLPEAAVEELDVLASDLNKDPKFRIEGHGIAPKRFGGQSCAQLRPSDANLKRTSK